MSEALFPNREWISAQASYATQASNLIAMIEGLVDQIAQLALKRPQRLAVIGIGASHAAAGSAVFEMRHHGLDAVRFLPSELPAGLSGFDGLAVLVSQSGRSAEVVDLARCSDTADLISLTNYAPSPLGTLCEKELNLGNLPDSSVSFVSFNGTMLALALLCDYWIGPRQVDRWKQLIIESAQAVEQYDLQIRGIAQMLVDADSIDIVAPAPLMSTAEEASLMLREGPRLFATAMETRQYLHGPMDAAGPGAHLVFGGEREALLIAQLSERTQRLAFVTGQTEATPTSSVGQTLTLPARLDDPVGFAIASTFVAQKITLHAAELRGIDINEPAFKRLDTKTDKVISKNG